MYELLVDLLVSEFGVESDRIAPGATVTSLELDSLALAEIAVIVTERTGVRVEDVDIEPGSTLGRIAELFEETAGKKPTPA